MLFIRKSVISSLVNLNSFKGTTHNRLRGMRRAVLIVIYFPLWFFIHPLTIMCIPLWIVICSRLHASVPPGDCLFQLRTSWWHFTFPTHISSHPYTFIEKIKLERTQELYLSCLYPIYSQLCVFSQFSADILFFSWDYFENSLHNVIMKLRAFLRVVKKTET